MGSTTISAMKKVVKESAGGIFRHLLSLGGLRNVHLILMYHRVLEGVPKGLHDPGLFVTARTFEMHLREIARFFDIVSLEHARDQRARQRPLCTITFDDGWIDNYETAFPVLKRHQAPATIFVPVELVGSDHCFWWQDLSSLANCAIECGADKAFVQYFRNLVPSWSPTILGADSLSALTGALKAFTAERLDDLIGEAYGAMHIALPTQRTIMGWGHLEEMGGYGITFGPHGLRHYILDTLPCKTKKEEIFKSRALLEGKGIITVPFFSFPNGNWDRESLAFMSAAGYRGGVTTRGGYNDSRTNPFLLNRIGLHEYISHTPDLFWFRIFRSLLAGPKSW